MKMTDTRQIDAPPAAVYAALLDPKVLQACVPGAQDVTGSPEEGFEATVVQKVGPVKATFKGQVTLSEMVENQSLTISGEGKGGAAGFAKGGADVRVTEKDGGTELSYDVEAKVGGKLAQLGSRIIDGFAKKMADQFFDNFKAAVEGPAPEEAPVDNADAGAEAEEPKKGWLGRLTGKD
ncbi:MULTISPECIES: CoxG family protein [Roseobacteraceae]|jgi:carbon monoxide dehydrogenase subunit G|uniref:Carbon monoxide dehydrogenase subunit G (CoxG) n=1 Tax=Pseudosulfitobacter pseudonitzschiae TaxID=1402135 RepID=A0A221K2S5_9RHOB|nr:MULTISPECIES: carbon monoxide dehydrogenase subunit G [Roseobacteraceae]ASM73301.1 carbon monoxide dehydrogenase subunit G (CoxG) [Pseudosulfitobacter pseudonitzschiae]